MPLAGKQTGPQGAKPEGWGGGRRDRVGLWLAARGDDTGDGRCSKSKRIGVKEMLTDAVNVICLLPQEVGSSLYCSFVPSTFSSPNIRGLRAWRKLRNCMEAEDAEGPCSQVEKVLYNFK